MKTLSLIILSFVGTTAVYSQSPTVPLHIKATKLYKGIRGEAKISVNYATASDPSKKELTKPLIVVEGFDISMFIENPRDKEGFSRTLQKFMRKVSNSNSSTLEKLLTDEQIRTYDIVYVDWVDPLTYMECNAYALQEVFTWVNNQKKDKRVGNVVWGESMGGVIARYALADLEGNGKAHQARLFISYDAPQQGANLPLGLQYLYRLLQHQYIRMGTSLAGKDLLVDILNKSYRDLDQYASLLDAPAAQQMLPRWVAPSGVLSENAYNAFYNKLRNRGIRNSGGYPTQCRNIAVSNGNENGYEGESLSRRKPIIDFDIRVNASPIINTLLSVAAPLFLDGPHVLALVGGILGIPGGGAIGALLFVPGSNHFGAFAKVNPLGPTGALHHSRAWYTKKILLLIPVSVTILEGHNGHPRGMLPYDTYGGGYFMKQPAPEDIRDSGILGNMSGHFKFNSQFNFISTVSALDVKRGHPSNTDYETSYVKNRPTDAVPFNNILTTPTNEKHLTLTKATGDWIADELETEGCTTIEGGNQSCGGSKVTLNFRCNGGSVSWKVSEKLTIESSSSNRIIVRGSNESTEPTTGTVTAEVTMPSGIVRKIEKEISVTPIDLTFSQVSLDGPTCLNYFQQGTYILSNPPPSECVEINWEITAQANLSVINNTKRGEIVLQQNGVGTNHLIAAISIPYLDGEFHPIKKEIKIEGPPDLSGTAIAGSVTGNRLSHVCLRGLPNTTEVSRYTYSWGLQGQSYSRRAPKSTCSTVVPNVPLYTTYTRTVSVYVYNQCGHFNKKNKKFVISGGYPARDKNGEPYYGPVPNGKGGYIYYR